MWAGFAGLAWLADLGELPPRLLLPGFHLYVVRPHGTPVAEEVPMAAYSMDLRTRVLEDSDAGMRADAVAEKYRVSLSWVNRLKQRRRESGEIAPRRQTRWRTPMLTPDLPRLE